LKVELATLREAERRRAELAKGESLDHVIARAHKAQEQCSEN
jgi:hypothetical protein